MVSNVGKAGSAVTAAAEKANVVNTPANTGGAGGLLSSETDSKEAATQAKFGEVIRQIQAKYGEKAEKPREIKKTLGKDDFLRIMITQMKNQDPTNPFKAEQMATEIAQFTSVEQLQNVNQNLTKMTNQNRPLEQMAMTNMIGKVVTIDRERFPHQEGQNEPLSFSLPKDASSVSVNILNEVGESVHHRDLGAQKAGAVSFVWDGTNASTLPAKGGSYIYRVTALDGRGQAIDISPQAQGRVIGVSFEGTEPVFLVGDAQHQDKITLRNIVRIEEKPPALSPVAATAPVTPVSAGKVPSPAAYVPPKFSNFIPFQKGGAPGDATIELPVGPPKSVGVSAPKIPNGVEEKGFPNGLQDPEQQKGGESS